MRDGWGPVQVSSHTPVWHQRRDGWWSNQRYAYNPRHFLLQNPSHRYSQSPWQPKRTALQQMWYGNNYVIPLSTHPSEPNPYFERKMDLRFYTIEEKGRLGQDINWVTLGTRGG